VGLQGPRLQRRTSLEHRGCARHHVVACVFNSLHPGQLSLHTVYVVSLISYQVHIMFNSDPVQFVLIESTYWPFISLSRGPEWRKFETVSSASSHKRSMQPTTPNALSPNTPSTLSPGKSSFRRTYSSNSIKIRSVGLEIFHTMALLFDPLFTLS